MSVKLTYQLKQETPMIHFQHNDRGATLRGSELKPKLDRFLYRKYSDKIKKEWKTKPDEHDALNYKVKISATGKVQKSSDIDNALKNIRTKTINAMYFGNMIRSKDPDEIKEKYKETVFYEDPIELEIICSVPELRKLIDESINEFFMVTNFGTRQSKGFGGFTVLSSNGEEPENVLRKNGYKFFYAKTNNANDSKTLMNQAATVYAIMKGGLNQSSKTGHMYIKGYIQRQYFDDIGEPYSASEKRMIKKQLIYRNDSDESGEPRNYLFSRALLGLPDKYEYREKYLENGKKLFRNTVEVKSNDISRFQSVLTVKVIKGNLYFIFNDSYELILDKKFELKESFKGRNVNIRTPKKFDVDRFIEGYIAYYKKNVGEIKKAIYEPYKGTKPLELLNGKDVKI